MAEAYNLTKLAAEVTEAVRTRHPSLVTHHSFERRGV